MLAVAPRSRASRYPLERCAARRLPFAPTPARPQPCGHHRGMRLVAHLQTLHFAFHDRAQTGQLMAYANTDIQQINNAVLLIPLTIASSGRSSYLKRWMARAIAPSCS